MKLMKLATDFFSESLNNIIISLMNQNKQQLATPFDNCLLTNKTKPI